MDRLFKLFLWWHHHPFAQNLRDDARCGLLRPCQRTARSPCANKEWIGEGRDARAVCCTDGRRAQAVTSTFHVSHLVVIPADAVYRQKTEDRHGARLNGRRGYPLPSATTLVLKRRWAASAAKSSWH